MHQDVTLNDLHKAADLVVELGGDINQLFDQPGKITFPRIQDDSLPSYVGSENKVQVIYNVGVAADHEVDLCIVNDRIMVRKSGQLDTTANELVAYAALGNNKYTPRIYGFDVSVSEPPTNNNWFDIEDLAHGSIFMEPCAHSIKGKVNNIERAITELIAAVKYIHSCNVLHGDIKPDNVLICTGGHIKLTDFGLAETRMPRSVSLNKYTPCFRPPELYAFGLVYMDAALFDEVRYPLGPEQDIYALGCTLYYMITGEKLFSDTIELPPWTEPEEGKVYQNAEGSILEYQYDLPLYQASVISPCIAPGHWADELYKQVKFIDVDFEDTLYKTGKYETMLRLMLDSNPLEREY